MNNKKIYINGVFVNETDAAISPFDRGLLYGDGLFETMKAVNGDIEYYKDHLARLKKGCLTLKILYTEFSKLEPAIKKLLRANELNDKQAYIKILITRGVDASRGGHSIKKETKPTVIITTKELAATERKSIDAITVISPYYNNMEVKSLNYLPSVLAKEAALKKNAHEAIFVDEKGFILEGTSSNVFIVKNDILYTPPLNGRILDGVMRKQVLKFSRDKKLKVIKRNITTDEIYSSDLAFITNSIVGINIIEKIDGRFLKESDKSSKTIKVLKSFPGVKRYRYKPVT